MRRVLAVFFALGMTACTPNECDIGQGSPPLLQCSAGPTVCVIGNEHDGACVDR